jgi:hypothetical protein
VAVTIVTLVANPSEGGSVEGGGAHIVGRKKYSTSYNKGRSRKTSCRSILL